MDVETVSIERISHDPANVRTHGPRNLDAIKASLRKFGQQKPIVVDRKGTIIAGNGTLAAARELGWKEINVVRSDLIGVDATAYAIADNRTAELAEWDNPSLAQMLDSLKLTESIDELVTGFSPDEMERLFTEHCREPEFNPVNESEQGRLDEKSPIECPHCGKEFVPK